MSTPMAFVRRLHTMVCAFLLLAFASSASSMSIRELRGLEKASKQGTIYVQYYLVGVMEGVMEASNAVQRQGGQALACVNDRRLEPAMAQSLYQAELRRNADLYEADMPVQLVMLNALASAYAC